MKKKNEPSPAELLEREVQKTIDNCLALKPLTEEGHYNAVEEALEAILFGVKMRLDELRAELDE